MSSLLRPFAELALARAYERGLHTGLLIGLAAVVLAVVLTWHAAHKEPQP